MFKDCYVNQEWVGCSGRYDHLDRGLLILAILAGIAIIAWYFKK
jgi:hypothetical protein